MIEQELEFPKAPQKATRVRLQVGKYKKAIVSLKDRDTLRGVSGIYQHGYLVANRIFTPLGSAYQWNGYSYLDDDGKPNAPVGEGKVPLPNK
jgi:hypothetical protein